MNSCTLYYIHDPMCSWCWGFNNTWLRVQSALPKHIQVVYILGGLAPDSNISMSGEMQNYIQEHWRKVQASIPTAEFNFDFWKKCTPLRSTYPACRAIIACNNQAPNLEDKMILAIQQAYYLHAKNPSLEATLIGIASKLGLDVEAFTKDLHSQATHEHLHKEITLARKLTNQGFPSLVLQTNHMYQQIAIDYNNPERILSQINT